MVFDVQEPGHELHPLEEGDLLLPILERCDGRDSLLFQSLSPSMVSSESWKSDLEGESDCE